MAASRPAPSWIQDDAALVDLVAQLAGEARYGIDTEFHRERTYWPKLALVQLAWAGGVALVDPVAVDLSPLALVLDGPGLAIVHAGEQDLEVLDRAVGTVPARLFDTQIGAGFIGMQAPALATLVERGVGVTLAKGDRLTDWLARPLSADQRQYAASDVEHLLELHGWLVSELGARGRLGWALDECELARERWRRPREPDEAWWRLKDARALRGTSRGVAQELAAWRERRAAAIDRPIRSVLPDLAVTAVAQRPPADQSALRRVRGLESRFLASNVPEQILAAVRAGQALQSDRLHLPEATTVDRRLRASVALAGAWLAQRAAELELDVSLLATRADLEALVSGRSNRLTEGWRHEALDPQLTRVLSGDLAIALDGRGGLVLEERSHRPAAR